MFKYLPLFVNFHNITVTFPNVATEFFSFWYHYELMSIDIFQYSLIILIDIKIILSLDIIYPSESISRTAPMLFWVDPSRLWKLTCFMLWPIWEFWLRILTANVLTLLLIFTVTQHMYLYTYIINNSMITENGLTLIIVFCSLDRLLFLKIT